MTEEELYNRYKDYAEKLAASFPPDMSVEDRRAKIIEAITAAQAQDEAYVTSQLQADTAAWEASNEVGIADLEAVHETGTQIDQIRDALAAHPG